MKPQSPQRNALRTLKEYYFKDITEKIISCAMEVNSSPGPGLLENLYIEAIKGIHIAQMLTYLKAENPRGGLLINFNVDKLKEGIRRIIL